MHLIGGKTPKAQRVKARFPLKRGSGAILLLLSINGKT